MKKSLVLFALMLIGVLFASNLLANNDIVYGQTYHYEVVPGPDRWEIITVPTAYVELVLEFQFPGLNNWLPCGATDSDSYGFYSFSIGMHGNVNNADLIVALQEANLNHDRVKFRIIETRYGKVVSTFEWTNMNSSPLNIDLLIDY